MQNKKKLVMFMLSVCFLLGLTYAEKSAVASTKISLTIDSAKESFKLGEIISIGGKITNYGSDPIDVGGTSDSIIGIQISNDDRQSYRNYVSPTVFQSITVDGIDPFVTIKPGETVINQKTILWNLRPSVSHLNSDAAKPLLKGRILTDYAFPEPGTYSVKGVISVIKNGKPISVESEPIQITVTQPQGDDLEVWNLIKRNGNIGYFLQAGDVPRTFQYKTEEREALLKEIDSILKQYATSFYAASLRQSLDKFRASEAKRQEFRDKLQKQRPQ